MTSNTTEPRSDSGDSNTFRLRELRRIITRHRRQHEQAERSFHEWRMERTMSDQDMDDQLTDIGDRLTNRLQRQAIVSEASGNEDDCN